MSGKKRKGNKILGNVIFYCSEGEGGMKMERKLGRKFCCWSTTPSPSGHKSIIRILL
jgi:hypothetical protein